MVVFGLDTTLQMFADLATGQARVCNVSCHTVAPQLRRPPAPLSTMVPRPLKRCAR
jgi:hypothetical protein